MTKQHIIKIVKTIVTLAICAAVFFGGYRALDRLLCFKSIHGINQTRAMYYQPKNSIDVVFMGSSHIHCGINNAELWTDYGIASMDYSAAEQTFWQTYYYIQELLKTQRPKMICLDVFSAVVNTDDWQYKLLYENVYGMRFSMTKWKMLEASCETLEMRMQYISNMFGYHTRYTVLTPEDYRAVTQLPEDMRNYKGYTPFLAANPIQARQYPDAQPDGLTEKIEKYLRLIIELCQKEEIELFLMVVPYEQWTEYHACTFKEIELLAAEYSVPYVNYAEMMVEIGMDPVTDFRDPTHMNHQGATKFSSILGAYLSESCGIPDRRGEPGYESWDRFVEYVDELVKTGGH